MIGHTAICIASGSSLTQEDVDYCQGKGKVYVVNDCHRLAPWADVLYACDGAWWDEYNGVPEFKGEKWTIDHAASVRYDLNNVNHDISAVWSERPNTIASNRNSGFQALNLAFVQGATRIILLGYDMKLGAGNKRHWFGDHPHELNKNSNYSQWAKLFAQAAPLIPIPVINCTRDSALDCFPKQDLRNTL